MENLYDIKLKDIWAYLKGEDALFWLINIYLFLEYVRPMSLYPSLSVIPLTKCILILALGLLLLRHTSAIVGNQLNKLLFFFFLVILLSSMSALSPEVSFGMVPDFIAWMVIYFLIINIVNTEKRFLVFMLAFLLYSFKMSQFSFRNWALGGFGFQKDGSGGGPGWFHNSGEFGIQMCIFLPLSWYFFVALKKHWPKWKKCFFLFFPFTALTGSISSSSRGALVGVGAVLVVMLLKGKHKIKGIVVLIVIAVLVWSFLPEKQMARFESAGKDVTSVSRFQLWDRGIELVSQFPVLGVGYKNWGVAQQSIFGLDSMLLPHNVFIECASELGCLGLLVFILMIVYTFVNNYQTRKLVLRHQLDKLHSETDFIFYMAHGLDAALVGYLVSGFFVTVLYYPYFWINLAMTVALNAIARKQQT